MAPAITLRSQVWFARATIGAQHSGLFAGFHIFRGGLNDHLTGVFHAGGTQVHLFECCFSESPYAAMKIFRRAAEEQTSDTAQYRDADLANHYRHDPTRDSAGETVAHYQISQIKAHADTATT